MLLLEAAAVAIIVVVFVLAVEKGILIVRMTAVKLIELLSDSSCHMDVRFITTSSSDYSI